MVFLSASFYGGYWIVHHKMYEYVRRFDTRLVWLNLLFLLSIVLLPFTTSILGMYGSLLTAFSFYILNAIFTRITSFLCGCHILNPRKNLSEGMEEASARRGAYVRSVTMPVWFSIVGSSLCAPAALS
ncbi:MAG TPA: TMEM175 family protein [Chitinophagaceae bacterium]|nr:TMEM175 family protein [Chitinophagaceae bacterium]